MKKLFVVLLVFTLSTAALSSCSGNLDEQELCNSSPKDSRCEQLKNDELKNFETLAEIIKNINSFVDFSLSSQGASFFVVYDSRGNFEYLSVDVFGEMGRVTYSYTFTEHFIIHSVVEIIYPMPLFIDSAEIPNAPDGSAYTNRFIIFDGTVYSYISNDNSVPIQAEYSKTIIERLNQFIELINSYG